MGSLDIKICETGQKKYSVLIKRNSKPTHLFLPRIVRKLSS